MIKGGVRTHMDPPTCSPSHSPLWLKHFSHIRAYREAAALVGIRHRQVGVRPACRPLFTERLDRLGSTCAIRMPFSIGETNNTYMIVPARWFCNVDERDVCCWVCTLDTDICVLLYSRLALRWSSWGTAWHALTKAESDQRPQNRQWWKAIRCIVREDYW